MIEKIRITNYKIFKGTFELELSEGLNIIVGDNEAGKSTILEAIHLALTGIIGGKYLNSELTQYLFNNEVVSEYLNSLQTASPQQPPMIEIELYFRNSETAPTFMGNDNGDKSNSCGFKLIIHLDEKYQEDYESLVSIGNIITLPIEYYEPDWSTFARKPIMTRTIPVKSAFIDSSSARYQNGSDVYISRIVRQNLDADELVKVSQAHRKMRESFIGDSTVTAINTRLTQAAAISNKQVTLAVELLSRNAWETSLVTYLDEVPFHYIGKGEQSIVKTRLALSDRRTQSASVVLMEEPENHLAYARMNQLIATVKDECENQQVIISTHSSFVANKLGLSNLIFLHNNIPLRLTELKSDSQAFFEKLPGYDTLRLVVSKKTILVEGPSDELIVQKAYIQTHDGKLPIEDGIDVISVGTSFLRFLEIASRLHKVVSVITDNDGDISALESKYSDYLGGNAVGSILISYDKELHTGNEQSLNYNTLENLLLLANGRDNMNRFLGKTYESGDMLLNYMEHNKTDCALTIFGLDENVQIPTYITEAIEHICQTID
jgi:putative ATP-dependent endonuclease of OLD family